MKGDIRRAAEAVNDARKTGSGLSDRIKEFKALVYKRDFSAKGFHYTMPNGSRTLDISQAITAWVSTHKKK